MKKSFFLGLLVALSGLAGCGDDGGEGTSGAFANLSCASSEVTSANCVEIADAATLIAEVNLLEPDTTLVLGAGTFEFDNAVTIRANGISLIGQGIEETVLAFGSGTTQFNGVDVVGDDFLVQDLTVLDAPKDGIRVEDSDGVTFRRIRATWTNEGDMNNGAYCIYPVKSQNELVEDSLIGCPGNAAALRHVAAPQMDAYGERVRVVVAATAESRPVSVEDAGDSIAHEMRYGGIRV